MTELFHRYYIGTEPEQGLLVNGQYWRTRFGKETLQTMVNDGVFDEPEETDIDILGADNDSLRNDINDLEDHQLLLNQRILQLVTQLREAGLEPVEPTEESVRGDLED